jgi:hypothetical protein
MRTASIGGFSILSRGPASAIASWRRALADLIEARRPEIAERWLGRVEARLGSSRIELTELREALPEYLGGVVEILRASGSLEIEGKRLWADVSRAHAFTCVRLGFDIDALVHELIVLRRVLVEIARDHDLANDHTIDLCAEVIEAAIASAVASDVGSRDLLAKRA